MFETAEKLNSQAIILATGGSYKEAIACFVRAITIEKNNYLLWYNLGITYRDAGKLKEAKSALLKAYSISQNDEDVIESIALICYSMGDFMSALAYCREGLENNPKNSHLWNTAGIVYFNSSEYKNACTSFEQAVMINPYYYDAMYNLCDTYEQLGNKTGQRECLRRMQEMEKYGEY